VPDGWIVATIGAPNGGSIGVEPAILLVIRLLADERQGRVRRARAEHGLRRPASPFLEAVSRLLIASRRWLAAGRARAHVPPNRRSP
jgi:hypothetical protein